MSSMFKFYGKIYLLAHMFVLSSTSLMAATIESAWTPILVQDQTNIFLPPVLLPFDRINLSCNHRIRITTLHPESGIFDSNGVFFGPHILKDYIFNVTNKTYNDPGVGDDFISYNFIIANLPIHSHLLFGKNPGGMIQKLNARIYKTYTGSAFLFNDGTTGGLGISPLFYGPGYVTDNSISLEQNCLVVKTSPTKLRLR